MDFQRFGKASVIVGLQYAVETLQGVLDDIRNELNMEMNGAQAAAPKRGRPPGGKNGGGYWASMTPEERSAEGKRRMAVARERRAAVMTRRGRPSKALPSQPQHPDHPAHQKWIEANRKAVANHWASLSKAERKRRIARMQAARVAKRAAVVRLEKAS